MNKIRELNFKFGYLPNCIYICEKVYTMQQAATRKLIDIKAPVFQQLTLKAKRQGVSLKRYIEDLLEDDARTEQQNAPDGITDERVLSLIGIAKPSIRPESIDDDRLHYILSK